MSNITYYPFGGFAPTTLTTSLSYGSNKSFDDTALPQPYQAIKALGENVNAEARSHADAAVVSVRANDSVPVADNVSADGPVITTEPQNQNKADVANIGARGDGQENRNTGLGIHHALAPNPAQLDIMGRRYASVDITDILAETQNLTVDLQGRDNQLFGSFESIPRIGVTLRTYQGRSIEKVLARQLELHSDLRVFVNETIPISQAAFSGLKACRGHDCLEYTESYNGNDGHAGSYRSDLLVYDKRSGILYIIDLKRSVSGIGKGKNKSDLIRRMKAASLCVMQYMFDKYALGVAAVRPRIVACNGTGGRDPFIVSLDQIDMFLNVRGVGHAMRRAVSLIEEAMEQRFYRHLGEMVVLHADKLGLQVTMQDADQANAVTDPDQTIEPETAHQANSDSNARSNHSVSAGFGADHIRNSAQSGSDDNSGGTPQQHSVNPWGKGWASYAEPMAEMNGQTQARNHHDDQSEGGVE